MTRSNPTKWLRPLLTFAVAISLFGYGVNASAQQLPAGIGGADDLCSRLPVIGGSAIIEGDVAIGSCSQNEGGSWEFEARGAFGEALVGGGPRSAIIPAAEWAGATMPYEIDGSLSGDADVLQQISRAIRHWFDVAGVLIVPRSGESDYLNIVAGSGCTSFIGRTGGAQNLTLVSGGACGFGATVHEFGHAFGFYHTQSRQDRDTYVTINFGNISTTACGGGDCSHNFNKYSQGQDFGDYDYGSIMHYGATAFGIGGATTITPNEPEFSDWRAINGGLSIGSRSGLSVGDEASADLFRESCVSGEATGSLHWETTPWGRCETGCPAASRTRRAFCIDALGNCVADGLCLDAKPAETDACESLPLTCNFESGSCGWDHRDVGDGFDWVIGQGEAAARQPFGGTIYSGPEADHTLGTVDGSYYHLDTFRRFHIGSNDTPDGELAYLTSAPQDFAAGTEFSFWYHSFGAKCRNAPSTDCTTDSDCSPFTGDAVCDTIPGIELQAIPCDTGTPQTLWSADDIANAPTSSDAWREAVVDLPELTGARLRFVGTPLPTYIQNLCSEGGNRCDGNSDCFSGVSDTCEVDGPVSSFWDNAAIDDIALSVSCADAPSVGCLEAAQAKLIWSEKKAGKEKVKLQWKKIADATVQGDFGDPVDGGTGVRACVYDDGDALVASFEVARAGQLCNGKACWKAKGSKGFGYKDKLASADGVTKIGFGSGDATKGKADLGAANNAAKGLADLATGVVAVLSGNSAPTAQLLTTDGFCVTATLDNVKKDDGVIFSAQK